MRLCSFLRTGDDDEQRELIRVMRVRSSNTAPAMEAEEKKPAMEEEVDPELRIIIMDHVEQIIKEIIVSMNHFEEWTAESERLQTFAQMQSAFSFVGQAASLMAMFYHNTNGKRQITDLLQSVLSIQDKVYALDPASKPSEGAISATNST